MRTIQLESLLQPDFFSELEPLVHGSLLSHATAGSDVRFQRVLGALGEQPLDDPPKAVEGRGSTHHIGVPQPPAVGVLQHLRQ